MPPFFPPYPLYGDGCEPCVNPFAPRFRPQMPPGSRVSETVAVSTDNTLLEPAVGTRRKFSQFVTIGNSGLNPGDHLIAAVYGSTADPAAFGLGPMESSPIQQILVAINPACIPRTCATSFVAKIYVTLSADGTLATLNSYAISGSPANIFQDQCLLTVPMPTPMTTEVLITGLIVTVDTV